MAAVNGRKPERKGVPDGFAKTTKIEVAPEMSSVTVKLTVTLTPPSLVLIDVGEKLNAVGIDATSGAEGSPAVRATATMTLALPKAGLCGAAAARHVGELYLADIGVPPGLHAGDLAVPVGVLFAQGEFVRVR